MVLTHKEIYVIITVEKLNKSFETLRICQKTEGGGNSGESHYECRRCKIFNRISQAKGRSKTYI